MEERLLRGTAPSVRTKETAVTVEKARAALDAAKAIGLDDVEPDKNGLTPIRLVEPYQRLVNIANVQAGIALAEAAERIADSLAEIASALHRQPVST